MFVRLAAFVYMCTLCIVGAGALLSQPITFTSTPNLSWVSRVRVRAEEVATRKWLLPHHKWERRRGQWLGEGGSVVAAWPKGAGENGRQIKEHDETRAIVWKAYGIVSSSRRGLLLSTFPPVLSSGNAKWVGVAGDMAAKAATLTDELCGGYWASINICTALEWQVISSLIRFWRQYWLWLLVRGGPSLTLHAIIAFDGSSWVLVFVSFLTSAHFVYLSVNCESLRVVWLLSLVTLG